MKEKETRSTSENSGQVFDAEQQPRQDARLAPEPLTRSEVDLLRQKKRQVSASYRKVIEEHVKQYLASR